MAPDRGSHSRSSSTSEPEDHELSAPSSPALLTRSQRDIARTRSDHACYATRTAPDSALDGTNFTFRGLATGWVSGMAMPASLIGFAVFKALSPYLALPFTPVENVLVQTVAGAVGTMPLGLGFVGVMPSLEFLLKKSEGAPIDLSLWRLFIWGVGLCLFGVVFAVPLRKQVIIRERLKFPSGTATALMISVLHGGAKDDSSKPDEIATQGTEEREELLRDSDRDERASQADERDIRADWKKQIRLLVIAFSGSGIYTLVQYFLPVLHRLPVFGSYLANTWVWNLNPSPAYVGQGIIMGPATTFHMLLGAVVGWAVLSPIAKHNGWAPGPVDDWETGSKGWIVWVSLAIMLADAIVSLGWLLLLPTVRYSPGWIRAIKDRFASSSSWTEFLLGKDLTGYFALDGASRSQHSKPKKRSAEGPDELPDDAPPHHLVSARTVSILLPLTLVLCVVCIHVTFGRYMPISLNILAILLALVLSIMGVRAQGETDLNPVSGISKLTQLVFALIPLRGRHANHAIVINLLAGAVSEAGALQAGDMLQDLKAGHLIGASPKAQFYGQMIGSLVGAFVSAAIYKLYVSVYQIPGELFEIPTAYVWIFTARMVTGKGLPPMAWQFALVAGVIFVATTCLRIYLLAHGEEKAWCRALHPWIPGGIAVAVGMYNTPSFTLARTVGGIISYWWVNWKQRTETKVIVLASGLILGEGVVSIVNLVLASFGVPHL
ncbi:hypothetical protein ABEF93_003492 [Exophiala dermatitidis]